MQAESQYYRHTFTPSWCDAHRHKLHFLIYIGRRCKWALCWTCVLLPACLRRLIFERDNFFFYWVIVLIILNFTVALKCTTQHNGTLHLLNRWTCCFAFHTRFKNTSDINSTSRQPRCHGAGGPPCCHFFHCSPKALKAPLLSVQRTDGAFAPTAVSRVTYWCLMFPGKVSVVFFVQCFTAVLFDLLPCSVTSYAARC